MAGFKPGFLGAPGGLSERVYDLRGALAYMSKSVSEKGIPMVTRF